MMQKTFNFFIMLIIIGLVIDRVFTVEKMSNTDIKKIIQKEYMIDVDAIRNLSKLANDLTNNNKLVVPGGLEIRGPLKVSGDVKSSGNGYFGPAYIGKYNKVDSNYAQVSHINMTRSNNYALLQHKSGTAYLNGGNNKYIYLRSGNVTKMTVKQSGDIDVVGNATIGPAYIGKYGKRRTDYAHFSHKNNTSSKNYALIHHSNGTLYLNSSKNKPIHIAHNDSIKSNFKSSGEFNVNRNIVGNGIYSRSNMGAAGELAARKGVYGNCRSVNSSGYGKTCGKANLNDQACLNGKYGRLCLWKTGYEFYLNGYKRGRKPKFTKWR